MKRALFTSGLVALAGLTVPEAAFAHGGQYRGPGDTVPPGGGGGNGGGAGPASGPARPGSGNPTGPVGPVEPLHRRTLSGPAGVGCCSVMRPPRRPAAAARGRWPAAPP